MYKHFKIYKPYGYLSQFTKEHEHHKVLGDLYPFPSDVYPIGRLDKDSEGLLILSNDKAVVDKMLNPNAKTEKEYWVQVEGSPNEENLENLRKGVLIKVKTGRYHTTLPCEVNFMEIPLDIPPRTPPVRYRKSIPTTWLVITIMEGKNRQVRKMFAKIGYPVLRLIRYRIGNSTLFGMEIGMVKEISIN
jgi:23S rRNA pseudouridine2457 synthase